jgi:tRNA A58 N-methylase Trm61
LGQREAAVKEQEEVVEYKAELATMDSSELLRELNEWQFRNRGVRNNTDTLVLTGYMIFGALLTAR